METVGLVNGVEATDRVEAVGTVRKGPLDGVNCDDKLVPLAFCVGPTGI